MSGICALAFPRKILGVIDSANDKAMALSVLPRQKLLIEAGDNVPALATHRFISSFEVTQSLSGHSDSIRCLATLPDGATILSGSEDGDVRQWDHIGQELDTDGAAFPEPAAVHRLVARQ